MAGHLPALAKIANSSHWFFRRKFGIYDEKIAKKLEKATVEYKDSSHCER